MNTESIDDGLMTIEEACQFARMSRSSLYGLMQRGRLVSVKLGKSRRIPKAGLVAFLGRHVMNSTAADRPPPAVA
jgi:excisionase family DNA binding protein